MESTLTERHNRLVENLKKARENLSIAEKLLIANEAEMVRAIKENPLMRHIGLMGPENDLSDYIGGELSPEPPSIGLDAPKEILPNKNSGIDPVVINLIHEDPSDHFLYTYPCLKIADALESSDVEATRESTNNVSVREQKIRSLVNTIDPQELAYLAPEEPERATLALLSLKVGIWDWDAVNERVYTCPIWGLYMGNKKNNENPFEMLTASLDPSDAKHVENTLLSLGKCEKNSFSMRVQSRPKPDTTLSIQLNGLCVRNHKNEMLRILVTAINALM